MKPVNKKFVKDYYSIVKKPMDLETVAKKIKNHKYHDRTEFLSDIELILVNSIAYNGQESQFTEKAKALVQICAETLEEVSTKIFVGGVAKCRATPLKTTTNN